MSNQRTETADDREMKELVSKLHSLLPESRRRNTSKASAAKLLMETCSYIKSLHREVDDLSGRLAELISSTDSGDGRLQAAEIIRTIYTS